MRSNRVLAGLALLLAAGCPAPSAPSDDAGTCEPPCTGGTVCVAGQCVGAQLDAGPPAPDMALLCNPPCTAPTALCAGPNHCVACLADADCPAERLCRSGDCAPGCNTDDDCRRKTGGTKSCCSGACVDLAGDAANCGACGNACTATHGKPACVGSTCQPGQCDPGWGNCDNDPGNGCETNLRLDADHCAACGMKCSIPNAIAACADGCYLAACDFGWDDCNSEPSDGCEQNVTSDMKNCGGCGQPCNNKPHAKNTCVASSCVVTACDLGYSDCNNDASDGCEVATGTDPKNCGKCGNVCPMGLVCQNSSCTCPQCNFPNAKSSCVNNVCVLTSCLAGFADCNNNPADGCEVNLNADRDNCTACGKACPQGNQCIGGVCLAKWAFQVSQTIDGQTVKCSAVNTNAQYTECQDLTENGMYFPNGVQCGPFWSMQNSPYTDLVGFCQSLTGVASMQVYYTCGPTVPRAVWRNHVWSTTMDNGYSQTLRCMY